MGSPVEPLVATTRASPSSTGRPPSEGVALPLGVDEDGRGQAGQETVDGRSGKPGVDGQHGVPVLPGPGQTAGEGGAPRGGEGDELAHARYGTGNDASDHSRS